MSEIGAVAGDGPGELLETFSVADGNESRDRTDEQKVESKGRESEA